MPGGFSPGFSTGFSQGTGPMQLGDYMTQVQELVHDTSGIDFSATDLTFFVNNARNRVAMDFHNVRALFQNASLITGQEQYPIFGGVCGLSITNGGINFSTPPTITIGAPLGASGVTATAQAVVAAGAITQINMTNWGTGYALTTTAPSGPTITIGGPGSGAVLAPLVESNTFDVSSISVLWGLQRYTMGWLPFTMFEAFCRANPTLRRQPAVWTTHTEQNILFVYPIPDQAYLVDIDAVALPYPLVSQTDVDLQVIPPVNDCVQFYAAYLALLKLQNFEQAGYYEKKYDARAGQAIRTRQTRRMMNVYRNAWRRINRW